MSSRHAVVRRLVGGVAVAVLLAAAVVSTRPDLSRSASPPRAAPTSARTEATPTEATPTEATPTEATPTEATPTEATPTEVTPTEVTPTGSPRPSGDAGPSVALPTSGPWLTEPGSLLVATPERDGSFTVSERVLLPQPATGLELVPPDLTGAGAAFAATTPAAVDVQVSAGGQPVPAATTVDAPLALTWDVPTDRVELRYRLTGATVVSTPSTPGRALGAIGPLAGPGASEPVVLVVTGPSALNLSCPLLPDPACAATGDGYLTLARPVAPEQSLVLIQLDLPEPG